MQPAPSPSPEPTPDPAPGAKPPLFRAGWWPFIALAVPVSSLLGLGREAMRQGWGFVGDVWAANIVADLLFVLLTAGATWFSAWLVLGSGKPGPARLAIAAAAAFLLHAATYVLCWSLAGPALGYPGLSGSTLTDVVGGGILGLAIMTFFGPLLGLFMPRVTPVA